MAQNRNTMINSMTGFGRAQAAEQDDAVSVELNSVNSRYLKISTRLPEALYPYDKDIQDLVKKYVLRGSINVFVTYRSLRPETSFVVSTYAVKGYLEQLRLLKEKAGVAGTVSLDALLALPGVVVSVPNAEQNTRVWRLAKAALEEALKALNATRAREGVALQKDLFGRVGKLKQMLARVKKQAPAVVADYRKKIHARINLIAGDVSVALDPAALSREVAIFADRCDISEEVTRMASHLEHFVAAARTEKYSGRKLDFIAQEMLRETNTLGAKANSASLSTLVVQMKSEIDKIKEQLQNVE